MTLALIVINGFIPNTSGRPFSVNLESAEGIEFCPVNYLRQYSSLRGSALGPLFCFADGAPLKTTDGSCSSSEAAVETSLSSNESSAVVGTSIAIGLPLESFFDLAYISSQLFPPMFEPFIDTCIKACNKSFLMLLRG